MKIQTAVETAREIVGGSVVVTRHYGANMYRNRGVELRNCAPGDIQKLGQQVESALPRGRLDLSSGRVVVWFDESPPRAAL